MDLHELQGEMRETGEDKFICDKKSKGQDPLLPVSPETAQDVPGIVFIDKRIPVHNTRAGAGR